MDQEAEQESYLDKKFDEYYENYDMYMKTYVVPEVYARQLASYFYRGLLVANETLIQYVGSIGDAFNVGFDFEEIRDCVEEILKIKYNLEITNDKPLEMKFWKWL